MRFLNHPYTANAPPTSEGAIQIAMEELPITLHGSKILVVGYGRLGRVLARQLRGLGATVAIAARSYTDLAWAQVWSYGVERADQLSGWLCGYDLVVNTVPAPVLGKAELSDLKPGCLVIDLASKTGGDGVGIGLGKRTFGRRRVLTCPPYNSWHQSCSQVQRRDVNSNLIEIG